MYAQSLNFCQPASQVWLVCLRQGLYVLLFWRTESGSTEQAEDGDNYPYACAAGLAGVHALTACPCPQQTWGARVSNRNRLHHVIYSLAAQSRRTPCCFGQLRLN